MINLSGYVLFNFLLCSYVYNYNAPKNDTAQKDFY